QMIQRRRRATLSTRTFSTISKRSFPMPSKDLISSIDKPGSSFAGASRTASTKRWGPNFFQIPETSDTLSCAHWLRLPLSKEGCAGHWISFHVLGASGATELPEPLKVRLACHLLLTQLPDEGLEEALESLTCMWQFYRVRLASSPALPAPPSKPARLGDKYVRPEF